MQPRNDRPRHNKAHPTVQGMPPKAQRLQMSSARLELILTIVSPLNTESAMKKIELTRIFTKLSACADAEFFHPRTYLKRALRFFKPLLNC